MNKKDRTIQDLMAALPMEENAWIVVDHWDADLCAIGIARADRPRQLVYISTFGRGRGRYDYQCEMPSGPGEEDFTTTAAGDDVDFEALLVAVKKHLAPDEPSGGKEQA
ncbi:hypothetical protein U0E10_27765 [Burkholderia ubonensis]|uniref:hypothetical protein n=1 Tax=Burkholderia ubonensis TaxID=101571 RepID=UPI002AB45364|nr:hypothetical protein [Burkholderia ubonensis]MDY7791693.1 hypothetical protein [Burkholderia ubonensis]